MLHVYSQSQIKPQYTTQYSVFTLYYINLHNMFRPLMVAILRSNYNHIQRLSLLPADPFESGLVSMVYLHNIKLYVSINK
jgi:ferric iron reductase protein FhuF